MTSNVLKSVIFAGVVLWAGIIAMKVVYSAVHEKEETFSDFESVQGNMPILTPDEQREIECIKFLMRKENQ